MNSIILVNFSLRIGTEMYLRMSMINYDKIIFFMITYSTSFPVFRSFKKLKKVFSFYWEEFIINSGIHLKIFLHINIFYSKVSEEMNTSNFNSNSNIWSIYFQFLSLKISSKLTKILANLEKKVNINKGCFSKANYYIWKR